MHADALVIGQFIKAAEFGKVLPAEPTWTIARIEHEEVASMKHEGKMVVKGIVYFRDVPRGWVINTTNKELLKGLLGTETDDWIGRPVTLHAPKVSVGRGQEPGIRVKGSPELTAIKKVVVKLPKRAPVTFELVPTGRPNPTTGGAKPRTRPARPDWSIGTPPKDGEWEPLATLADAWVLAWCPKGATEIGDYANSDDHIIDWPFGPNDNNVLPADLVALGFRVV